MKAKRAAFAELRSKVPPRWPATPRAPPMEPRMVAAVDAETWSGAIDGVIRAW